MGIGGIMGGASSEIGPSTTEVLLEAAYFTPMAIARTSKRLGLRTEASARFERGCDPWGIEPAVRRFCQLLAETRARPPRWRRACSTSGATCPSRSSSGFPSSGCTARSGCRSEPSEVARLLEPIGFSVLEDAAGHRSASRCRRTGPTYAPSPTGWTTS